METTDSSRRKRRVEGLTEKQRSRADGTGGRIVGTRKYPYAQTERGVQYFQFFSSPRAFNIPAPRDRSVALRTPSISPGVHAYHFEIANSVSAPAPGRLPSSRFVSTSRVRMSSTAEMRFLSESSTYPDRNMRAPDDPTHSAVHLYLGKSGVKQYE